MAADKNTKSDKSTKNEPGVDEDKPIKALTEEDVRIMQAYGAGPYTRAIKKLENEVKELSKKVNEIAGIKESDTGLAHPSRWDLVSDKQMMQEEQPLQVRWMKLMYRLLIIIGCHFGLFSVFLLQGHAFVIHLCIGFRNVSEGCLSVSNCWHSYSPTIQ